MFAHAADNIEAETTVHKITVSRVNAVNKDAHIFEVVPVDVGINSIDPTYSLNILDLFGEVDKIEELIAPRKNQQPLKSPPPYHATAAYFNPAPAYRHIRLPHPSPPPSHLQEILRVQPRAVQPMQQRNYSSETSAALDELNAICRTPGIVEQHTSPLTLARADSESAMRAPSALQQLVGRQAEHITVFQLPGPQRSPSVTSQRARNTPIPMSASNSTDMTVFDFDAKCDEFGVSINCECTVRHTRAAPCSPYSIATITTSGNARSRSGSGTTCDNDMRDTQCEC
jgi:hypothetical protein